MQTLKNGVVLPDMAFGTWKINDADSEMLVQLAIDCGYRHIDTAAYYGNEEGIGRALKSTSVSREELFITTKVWNDCRGYEKTLEAFEASMKRLQLDYLDMYLVHWPAVPEQQENWSELNAETWRALEDLYLAGRVRVIGVCNFMPLHLEELKKTARILPMLDQIEFHPGYRQEECVNYGRAEGIALEAWAPLGRGEALTNEVICEIAARYEVKPAMLVLQWVKQHELLPIVKSSSRERMLDNRSEMGRQIEQADMDKIDALPFWGNLGKSPDKFKA